MRKVITCLMALVFSSIICAQERTVLFATDESPPYTINTNGSDKLQGFMVDIAREIFKNAGFGVDVKFTSYKRSIQDVHDGNANGVLLISRNSAPDLIYLKNPIVKDKVVFIVKKGNKWRYKGVQDLGNLRIGSGVGFDFADQEINEYIKKKTEENSPLIQLISGDDINLRNFQKLLIDRLDVVIATEKIGKYVAIENNVWNQLEIAGEAKNLIIAQTGFNPKDKDSQLYADILSAGVISLTQSGKLSMIMKKYGLEE